MKFFWGIIALLGMGNLCFGATDQSNIVLQFISNEVQLSQSFEVDAQILVFDDCTIDNSIEWVAPEGWEIATITNITPGEFLKGDTIYVKFNISYNLDSLPFYPLKLSANIPENSGLPSQIRNLMVYFTPYSTIEVWDEADFYNLKRNWFIDTESNRERVAVSRSQIPTSNIVVPDSNEYEYWKDDFEEIFIEGLPYSIPMSPQNPDSVTDTTNIVFSDNQRAGACPGAYKHYLGSVTGKVLSPFRRDNSGPVFRNLPLEGLLVELWEKDNFPVPSVKLGETVTDVDGSFTIPFNTCQLGEGGEIELFVRVIAYNPEFDIEGKKALLGGFIVRESSGIRTVSYNNGNASNITMPTFHTQSPALRSVHSMVQCYRYANQYSGITLRNGLVVRSGFKRWGSFFFPNVYNYVPIMFVPGVATFVTDKFDEMGHPGLGGPFALSIPKPTIVLHEVHNDENIPRHEFGHFLMWHLQNTKWTDFLTGTYASHSEFTTANPRICWTEGWASGFMMIVDGHYYDWDEEGQFYGALSNEDIRNDFGGFNRGLESEYRVSTTIFDLWDGNNNYSHITASPKPTHADTSRAFSTNYELYEEGVIDEVELPFKTLCDAIVLGENGAPSGQVQSLQGFFENLMDLIPDCEDRSKIKVVTDQNRIVGWIPNFPNGEYWGLSTDEIFLSQDLTQTSPQGRPYNFTFTHKFDPQVLSLPGRSWNVVRTNLFTHPILSDDLTLADGATLHFNADLPAGLIADGSTIRPQSGQTLLAELCGPMALEATDFGRIELGDPNGDHPAEVRVSRGSTLTLGGSSALNQGTLRIHKGSKLVIEHGATLVIDFGGKIELPDALSILEIEGNIEIRDNATLSFTGQGKVIIAQTPGTDRITCGNNAAISFVGGGAGHLMIEIQDESGLFPPHNLANVSIENGEASLGKNALINTANANVSLQNLIVFAANPSYPHRGIYLNGQLNHSIKNITIEGGVTGLTAYQFYNDGALLRVENSSFLNCETGINLFDKGIELKNTTIRNCQTGLLANGAAFYSSLQNCTVNQNITGVDFRSASASLHINGSQINNNQDGVIFNGPGSLTGNCSSISDNTQYGVWVGMSGYCAFNNARNSAGAQMQLVRNGTSILLNQASGIDLFEGNNDLVPLVQGNGNAVTGTILQPCTITQSQQQANHWNTRTGNPKGATPVFGTDYNTFNLQQGSTPCISSHYLRDLEKAPPFSACQTGPPSGGGGSGLARQSPLYQCPSCSDLNTTHYPNTKLDVALRGAISTAEMQNSSGNDSLALVLLDEIVRAEPFNPNPDEKYLFRLAYRIMAETYAHAGAIRKISPHRSAHFPSLEPLAQKMKQATAFHLSRNNGNLALAEYLAASKRSVGFRGEAVLQLDSLRPLFNQQHQSYLEYLSCLAQTEEDVLEQIVPIEDFENAFQSCFGVNKSRDFLQPDPALQAALQSLKTQESNVKYAIYPNPTNGLLNISIENLAEESVHLKLVDFAGRIQLAESYQINNPHWNHHLNISSLPKGAYILHISGASSRYSQKIMVF